MTTEDTTGDVEIPKTEDLKTLGGENDSPLSTGLAFVVGKDHSKSDVLLKIEQLMQEASLIAQVPDRDDAFVPFGDFDDIREIIKARIFFPFYITGHTGCGKTFQIEQACAMEKREHIRVPITIETDEDDLIGGFRLKNGETVFELGPVVVGMLRGCVTLLDEVDLAGPKLMCLQPVMEGKPLTIKKLGITIKPAPGFQIFATANTKGRGSDDGKYIGANMQNEAAMDRYAVTIEQQYPPIAIEKKILQKKFEQIGGVADANTDAQFDMLAKWADAIRETYVAEGVEDMVSTRRLTFIVAAYKIYGDMDKAVRLCLNRFDKQVQEKFLDFLSKLKPENIPVWNTPAPAPKAKPAAKPKGAPW